MRPILSALILVGSLFSATPVIAGETLANTIKAAYLYKFSGYVQWPAGASTGAEDPLVIGVEGADEVADELQKIAANTVAKPRRLVIRKLRPDEPTEGIHMLFIGNLRKADIAAVIAKTRGRSVLTVTDSEDAFMLGSMINFVLVEDKLRFVVSLKSVGPSNLKISALMLAAALKVEPGSS